MTAFQPVLERIVIRTHVAHLAEGDFLGPHVAIKAPPGRAVKISIPWASGRR
jgi:hypothetical protein